MRYNGRSSGVKIALKSRPGFGSGKRFQQIAPAGPGIFLIVKPDFIGRMGHQQIVRLHFSTNQFPHGLIKLSFPQMSVAILQTGTAAEYQISAIFGITGHFVNHRLINHLVSRNQQHRVIGKIGGVAHKINRSTKRFGRFVIFQEMSFGIPLRSLFIQVNSLNVIGINQDSGFTLQIVFRNGCFGIVLFPQSLNFLNKFGKFQSTGSWCYPIGSYNSVVILLVTIQRSPVTVGTGKFASSGKYMPQPHTNGSRKRLWINTSPVHLSRLKLHNPISTFHRTEKVICHGDTRIFANPITFRSNAAVASINHVTGIRNKIELLTHTHVSNIVHGNVVRSNPLIFCGKLTDHPGLLIKESSGFVIGKTVMVELLVQVHAPLFVQGNVYFLKIAVSPAPKIGSPGLIYRIDGFIFPLQPIAEPLRCIFAII